MASSVNPPRGMRDFLPAEKRHRDAVLRTITDTYERHGFEAIETPVLEDHATLHSGLGGDNEKLSFQVLRRGLSVDDVHQVPSVDELADLGLRFDLTVPLARFVATHQAELPPVFRALHVAPVWRAERPQKGRFRQFVQCDIDMVGEASTLAEREVLIATADALDTLGLTDYRFRINDRRLLSGVLSAARVSDEAALSVMVTLDKLDKVGVAGVLDELRERHGDTIDHSVISSVLESAQSGDLGWDADAIASLMSVELSVAESLVAWAKSLVDLWGPEKIVFDPTLVRGMGYYTGSIVELEHPGLGVSLGGGGRYDGMIGRFAKTNLPAFGFSLGFERLMEVVTPPQQDSRVRVALVYDSDVPVDTVLSLKRELIHEGFVVRVSEASRNLKAVFERLQRDGFHKVAQVRAGQSTSSSLNWRDLDAES